MRPKLFQFFAILLFLPACSAPVESTAAPSPQATLPAATSTTAALACSTISVEPTPAFSTNQFSVTADDLIIGPESAPVTVMQYCDLQSVDCYGLASIMNLLLENHPGDMRLVIRPIPLMEMQGFENSTLAIQAVIAAKKQDRYLEVYNLLHDKYSEWANLTSVSTFEGWLKREVPPLGLDKAQFEADLKSRETIDETAAWYDSAKTSGVQPPYPLVLLNGLPVNVGLLYYEYLDTSISLIALGKRQFTECPTFSVDPAKQYIAALHTEKGDIKIQLFPDKAPLAVNSFVFLARQGWFDNITFHRVIPGFVAQAGDPSGTGQGGPGYFFNNEITDLSFDKPGMVGMANSGANTNGSQFFITYGPQPTLNSVYTIFGQVLQGMDVVERLTPRNAQPGIYLPPGDRILGVDIEEK
jgi:cyclophilin family peptidyl-prolyl cis-trans isomerase